MKKVYVIYKQCGETPLEALERLRAQENIPEDVPMTYAGRLDPAAEGLLLILTGEECKKKEEYTSRDKTYMAEILIGVSTDTYDLLGIPTYRGEKGNELREAEIFLEKSLGKQMQAYPAYSSKTVDGEQLHSHARSGKDVELPVHEVELYSYEDLAKETVSSVDILARVGEITASVTGDFRQEEIVRAWAELELPEKLPLVLFTLKVSSGFYVRKLADDLGNALGTGACLYSLVRTEIAE